MLRFLSVLILLASLFVAPMAQTQEVPATDAFTAPEIVQAEAVVSAESPASVVVDVNADSETTVTVATVDQEIPFVDISTPGNLIAVMAAVVPIVVEIFIKPIPGVMPWLLRIISFGLGGLGGLLVGFGLFVPVPYTLATSVLCGLAGGGGFTMAKWGSQAARGAGRTVLTAAISGVLLLCMIVMVGCGTTFTVRAGDGVDVGFKTSMPAYLIAKVEGVETFKLNIPNSDFKLRNECATGLVSTMAVDGTEPTCVPNPCLTGKFVFLPTGHTACQ
jgi:hypothetical protein